MGARLINSNFSKRHKKVMDLDVKVLTEENIEQYMDLRLEGLKNTPEAFGSSYEEEILYSKQNMLKRLNEENVTVFGAYEEGRLLGVVSLLFETHSKLKHRSRIFGFYIDDRYRNSGIGRSLIKRAVDEARKTESIEQIYLNVVTTHFIAKRLYKSLGFHSYAIEKKALKVDDKYFDEELMVLFLN